MDRMQNAWWRAAKASTLTGYGMTLPEIRGSQTKFYKDITLPFYGYNRPGAKISEGIREKWWLQAMMGGVKAGYDCIKAFSETDFTEDLKKFDVPTPHSSW